MSSIETRFLSCQPVATPPTTAIPHRGNDGKYQSPRQVSRSVGIDLNREPPEYNRAASAYTNLLGTVT